MHIQYSNSAVDYFHTVQCADICDGPAATHAYAVEHFFFCPVNQIRGGDEAPDGGTTTFRTIFRNRIGMSPKQYREKKRLMS